MAAYTATLIDIPVIPFDLYATTPVARVAPMLDMPKLNEPAYTMHGVFWPQQPTTHPALSTFNPTHTTAVLADQTSETGLLTALHPFIITGISTTVPARIRVYKSTAQRDADLSRAIGTDPSGDHGLLLEAVTTAGQLSWQVSPGVYVPVTVPQAPVTVTNLSGGSTAVTVSFTAIAME